MFSAAHKGSSSIHNVYFFIIVGLIVLLPYHIHADESFANTVTNEANTPENFGTTNWASNLSQEDREKIATEVEDEFDDEEDEASQEYRGPEHIVAIETEGNITVPTGAILNAIPYRVGQVFDKNLTNRLVKNIYTMGYFRQIRVFKEVVQPGKIKLIVTVEEKPQLAGVEFVGNKNLSKTEVEKKLDFSKIPAIDPNDIPRYVMTLKQLYRAKSYHFPDIRTELKQDGNRATLVFNIKEGERTYVKRINFKGNSTFTDKRLRSILFTKEDWILGFLDGSGKYLPEMIEGDKYTLETFYQSHGFLRARVVDVQIDIDEQSKNACIAYTIDEGRPYIVSEVHAPGNELCSEESLLMRIPIKPGQPYSREAVRKTIEGLRLLWGDFGYVNADINPAIQPNDQAGTVSITFYSEIGKKVRLSTINIYGNEKTRDKIIRRQLLVEEGGVLTTKALEDSKSRIENLGYFDARDGVNWKVRPIGNDLADLDIFVREVKTGRVELNMGYGGIPTDPSSPSESFRVGATISESNLFGRGVNMNLSGSYSKQEKNLMVNLTQPWLFDQPIYSSVDLYFKSSRYDEFNLIRESEINERINGGSLGFGALSRKLWDTSIQGKLGIDAITYGQRPIVRAMGLSADEVAELQVLLDRRFTSGTFIWLGNYAGQDLRNSPMHPSRGYQWHMNSRGVIESDLKNSRNFNPSREKYGFFKIDMDGTYYTPLIGERDLVLCLHAHLGIVAPFKNHTVPFRELYNIGGPASVRGYLFGEIGPRWRSTTNPNKIEILGATRAMWVNTELIFPISKDFSIKGAIFYDGGAGWATPDTNLIDPARLINNNFSYRHSIGIGFRILRPTPVKIDWGFKLDRRKGESSNEVHLTMYQEF